MDFPGQLCGKSSICNRCGCCSCMLPFYMLIFS